MVEKEKLKIFKDKVIKILNSYLGNDYILYVFGSCAKGKIVKSSDIDLAVYKNEIIPGYIIAEVKDKIDESTLRDVDLINLTEENINSKLLENILKEGIIWKNPKNSEELLKNLKKHLINLKK